MMTDFTPDQVVTQLQAAPLFKGVSQEDLLALVALMKPITYEPGTVLFEKGAPGDTMYVILSGELRIYSTDSAGHEITLTQYGAGHVFGDFTLLDDQPRSASASAIDRLSVMALERADFLKLMPEHTMIGLAMLRNLADRIRYITIYRDKIDDFGHLLEAGEYERALQEFVSGGPDDSDIRGMISAFGKMVHSLKERDSAQSNSPMPG